MPTLHHRGVKSEMKTVYPRSFLILFFPALQQYTCWKKKCIVSVCPCLEIYIWLRDAGHSTRGMGGLTV